MSRISRLVDAAKKLVFGPSVRTAINSEYVTQLELARELDRLQSAIRASMPGNPAGYGFKAYSQADEDGLLWEIVARLGIERGTFVEIGVGDGRENNTHFLLLNGWRGVWVDGSQENIAYIHRHLPPQSSRLAVVQAFVDATNVVPTVEPPLRQIGSQAVDVVSIDIDGNDVHVAVPLVAALQPAVVVAEYNARWRWPLSFTVPYQPNRRWAEDDFHGCSLAQWVDQLSAYRLVSCNLAGTNAFFVRRDRADVFPTYPPELLEQPARFFLAGLSAGHKATLKAFAEALKSP